MLNMLNILNMLNMSNNLDTLATLSITNIVSVVNNCYDLNYDDYLGPFKQVDHVDVFLTHGRVEHIE